MNLIYPSEKEFENFCNKILKSLHFDSLNEMQKNTIYKHRLYDNIELIAPTGSGKTMAFLLSLIQFLSKENNTQALIIAPTRELAIQIFNELKKIDSSINSQLCYGGHSFKIERNNLSENPKIIIGTPGRIADHFRRKTINEFYIQHIVFDEFDKILELGFESQIDEIMSYLKTVKRKTLVSATVPLSISENIKFIDPKTIHFKTNKISNQLSVKKIKTISEEKIEKLLELTRSIQYPLNGIIFVNHRDACSRLSHYLEKNEISAVEFHGGMRQDKREMALTLFRNGSKQFLVATNIASRGIDIQHLNFVIHYQLPLKESEFIHRNGRTARMKSKGQSILIQSFEEDLPDFIDEDIEEYKIENVYKNRPNFISIYIDKGKKNKISKIDIVGFCCSFNFIEKSDIGLIVISDYHSIFALKKEKCSLFLKQSKKSKIKNKTVRLRLLF